MRLEFQPQAERDLEGIGDYIAQDNPRRAITFLQELRAQCRKILVAPQAYRPRPELGEGIRSCAYGNYVIFFTEDGRLLRIIRVLHGAMDIEARFTEKNSAPDDKT
ncbi:type II toxin-antitoxin system RelE/ParE family toxin [Rhodoferax sp.]|uniref:type II toxin-antitoxin system RelE/ParE family toxin n=1 Tax=Rhodoferax sp. TaxID=50421 RepID=UPI002606EFE8|nr:type II toxin-antitoxin system RelE/ParE family toxin [Rhodoferax sp.]MDD4999654.1 type II toxin-antitoxin system RelE/ParE family toxin [Thiomonas arsenitoxydans]MDD5478417.1 type II toxin-antitoxin system RelE/ParE family toxin [Rhodoferax sp.]